MTNGKGPEWGREYEITERPDAPSPTVASCAGYDREEVMDALGVQVGGDHYKTKAIQPVQYCMANNVGFMEGSVIKYVTRWREKNGVEDLKKARHFLDMLIEAQ